MRKNTQYGCFILSAALCMFFLGRLASFFQLHKSPPLFRRSENPADVITLMPVPEPFLSIQRPSTSCKNAENAHVRFLRLSNFPRGDFLHASELEAETSNGENVAEGKKGLQREQCV